MSLGFILIITLLAILLGLLARQALANVDDMRVDANSVHEYSDEHYDLLEDYDLDNKDQDYADHRMTGE